MNRRVVACCQLDKERSRLFAMVDHLRAKPLEWSTNQTSPQSPRPDSPPPINLSTSYGMVCCVLLGEFSRYNVLLMNAPNLSVVRDLARNWLRSSLSRVRGQSPCEDLRVKPPETGDKYGCRVYRNTMKNTKHTNTEINTMIT